MTWRRAWRCTRTRRRPGCANPACRTVPAARFDAGGAEADREVEVEVAAVA